MYVSIVPNRNSPPAVLLRESFREDGKVRNRTLANLSHWPAERVEALRRALRGDFDQAALTGSPKLGPVFGLLFVLRRVAEELGIPAALGKTELSRLALFLVLARLAHRGSRLSAVRWTEEQAVKEVLNLDRFDEDDLYMALDELCRRQEKIEQQLFAHYLRRKAAPPQLFLYDVTSSYLEGEQNALGAYGYNRDGKKGKQQIVLGLLADPEGEPLAVRVFAGNTADPATVIDQIRILQEQFQVREFIFVGDRGMVKSKSIAALEQGRMHYITALTDPQIRRLLEEKILQLELFGEPLCEVEGERQNRPVRYVLRKNTQEAARERYRLEDKLARLEARIAARNQRVEDHPRCRPEAGQRVLEVWLERHKLQGLVELEMEGRKLILRRQDKKIEESLELAGCYVITTDVGKESLNTRQVHDSYMSLQKVERDFRTLKTGLLDVRPVFVRKQSRTRGHVFCCMLALKLAREMEQRLRAAFGATASHPDALTLSDALDALASLRLLEYQLDDKNTVIQLPQPSDRQKQILDALNVKLPMM